MLKDLRKLLLLLLFIVALTDMIHYCECGRRRTIEELFEDHEDEKNSMIAIPPKEDEDDDFYDEMDNWMSVSNSMNIIFFGPSISFMRLDAESILHILVNVKKHLFPISKALLAWDIVTDGKTAAFLRGRDFLAFGNLLNVVPEEDLYYTNFADDSVLKYFSTFKLNLSPRKFGVLVASYKRYYGNLWYKNGTYINALGFLLCGLPPSDFLQISTDVFKEITVDTLDRLFMCSPDNKQTKVMYELATHSKMFGPPYKWSSHEVTRLGLLLTLVPEKEIPSIHLEAITGITPEVMKAMPQTKLDYFTKQQIFRMTSRTRRMFILRVSLKNSLTMDLLTQRGK
ncbi:hypothetical protein NE865_01710 [Phthorimaea operculella]|nr:hypothetical protein NE865_01710 [Phthorimaea operculella]